MSTQEEDAELFGLLQGHRNDLEGSLKNGVSQLQESWKDK